MTNGFFDFDDTQLDFLRENERLRRGGLSPFACTPDRALRKFTKHYPAYTDDPDFYLTRTPYMVDIDKILHNPFYNRCSDKTQVFPFFKNDDITRRALHLQLVSRTARTIGRNLQLDCDLIEAIALGHDMGHTPFGHAGEALLDKISRESNRGRCFKHNVHSVRVLKDLLRCNLTLPTYDGVLCHNGERDFASDYYPGTCTDFDDFEAVVESCYTDPDRDAHLRPGTLEGCVVRISDMLAYLGKDRQDAVRAGLFDNIDYDSSGVLGATNLSILNNAITNLVKNSIGRGCLSMDSAVADDLNRLRRENSTKIYGSLEVRETTNQEVLGRMMRAIFERCMQDLAAGHEEAPVFAHHLALAIGPTTTLLDVYRDEASALQLDMEALHAQICIDYIASMTDDYFVDLYAHLFKEKATDVIDYHEYFE